jgi:hypothetical protein
LIFLTLNFDPIFKLLFFAAEWTHWEPWSNCEVKSGQSLITRLRKCQKNETPATGCEGSLQEEKYCTQEENINGTTTIGWKGLTEIKLAVISASARHRKLSGFLC